MSSCLGKEPMLPPTQQVVSSGDQAVKARTHTNTWTSFMSFMSFMSFGACAIGIYKVHIGCTWTFGVSFEYSIPMLWLGLRCQGLGGVESGFEGLREAQEHQSQRPSACLGEQWYCKGWLVNEIRHFSVFLSESLLSSFLLTWAEDQILVHDVISCLVKIDSQ